MMIGHPQFHLEEEQQQQRHIRSGQESGSAAPLPPLFAPRHDRGRARGRRIPPFLLLQASSSSSSSGFSGEDYHRREHEEQQHVTSNLRRRNKSRPQQQQVQRPANTTSASASPRILRRLSGSLIRRRSAIRKTGHAAAASSSSPSSSSSPLGLKQHQSEPSSNPAMVTFLQGGACPRDVLPLVLAYAGPRTAQALARTDRFWHNLLREEGTWKVQCQELYKWTPGIDEEPDSWKELYRSSPCVPVDYSSIESALAAVPNPSTVWLRPGQEFVLERPVTVSTDLTIRVMNVPVVPAYSGSAANSRLAASCPNLSMRRSSTRAKSPYEAQDDGGGAVDETWRSSEDSSSDDEEWSVAPRQQRPTRISTIVLHTHQFNKPVFWVQSGCLTLERVVLSHACLGVDIWSGNAALQIQPSPPPIPPGGLHNRRQQQQQAPAADTLALPPPRAVLNQCQVTSQSGRGVVVMGGGQALMQRCSIVDCAATGVYIGGAPSRTPNAAAAVDSSEPRRSRADLRESQVSGNGVGSYYRDALILSATSTGRGGLLRGHRLHRRSTVIARGHSGVYLEQGDCRIEASVIRSNALTGISAVSDQARLVVTGSTLEANGAQQLEAVPSRFIQLENNRIVDHPQDPQPQPLPPGMPLWPLDGHDQDMEDFVRMVMDQP